ncbi:hypothetical protein [Holospora curviuscula]|uniref:Transposase IS4-like domain-containing protein n=1 Tax=Holospora curviuscula TaxID=1082868 RepID=A0A2S5R9Q4_9PROT|nr:hypothetical protein [Holospora curviuscula]PPE04056.1 hypothetical protein HCUR_00591 [Holospora curviuscula]
MMEARKGRVGKDTLGYPLHIDVHSARPHDSKCSKRVLFGLKKKFPRLVRILANQGYLLSGFIFIRNGFSLAL